MGECETRSGRASTDGRTSLDEPSGGGPRAQQPEQQERRGRGFLRIVHSIVRFLFAGAERST